MKPRSLPDKASVLSLVIFLAVLFPVSSRFTEMRRDMLPPQPAQDIIEVTGNVFLIGFRAVVVDILYVQADALQQQGRIDQIPWRLTAILKLQPDLPEVWRFIAWHEIYNLGNEMDAPEDKWNFFVRGMEDFEAGARKMPRSGRLRLDAGHTMVHKCSDEWFPEASFFRRKVRQWKKKTCYEEAINWFEQAIRTPEYRNLKSAGTKDIWCRQITHTLDKWVRQAFLDDELDVALRVAERAVEKWRWVAGLHPGDPRYPQADLNLEFLAKAEDRLLAIKKYIKARELEKQGKRAEAKKYAEESLAIWKRLSEFNPRTGDGPACRKVERLVKRLSEQP